MKGQSRDLNDSGIDDEIISSTSTGDDFIHETNASIDNVITSRNHLCITVVTAHSDLTSENFNTMPCSPELMESDASIESDAYNDEDTEITIAILKALNLTDQMQGSISDFEDILQFAKELYCSNDSHLEEK